MTAEPPFLSHGMGLGAALPDWPPLRTEEVRRLLRRLPLAGDASAATITWRSPRPFSAAAIVSVPGGAYRRLVVKRHHRAVRTGDEPGRRASFHAVPGPARDRRPPGRRRRRAVIVAGERLRLRGAGNAGWSRPLPGRAVVDAVPVRGPWRSRRVAPWPASTSPPRATRPRPGLPGPLNASCAIINSADPIGAIGRPGRRTARAGRLLTSQALAPRIVAPAGPPAGALPAVRRIARRRCGATTTGTPPTCCGQVTAGGAGRRHPRLRPEQPDHGLLRPRHGARALGDRLAGAGGPPPRPHRPRPGGAGRLLLGAPATPRRGSRPPPPPAGRPRRLRPLGGRVLPRRRAFAGQRHARLPATTCSATWNGSAARRAGSCAPGSRRCWLRPADACAPPRRR